MDQEKYLVPDRTASSSVSADERDTSQNQSKDPSTRFLSENFQVSTSSENVSLRLNVRVSDQIRLNEDDWNDFESLKKEIRSQLTQQSTNTLGKRLHSNCQ